VDGGVPFGRQGVFFVSNTKGFITYSGIFIFDIYHCVDENWSVKSRHTSYTKPFVFELMHILCFW
jgi:hypothetical protein